MSSTGSSRASGPGDVLIVGCGIAGQALAIALAQRGVRARVIEAREDATPPGWGLLLTAPTLRALRRLELAERCVERGFGFDEITDCASDGTVVNRITMPALNGSGPVTVGIHRPALHAILSERVRELGVEVRLGVTCAALAETPDGVEVRCSDGTRERYDLVVGADGVRSQVRRLMGSETTPRYTDQLVWRALIARPAWATSLHTFAGPRHLCGVIPISDAHAYVFLTENSADRSRLSEAALVATLKEHLLPFSGPMDGVRELISDPRDIVRRPVEVTLEPRPWHRGRTVLIGDSAHAPSPQLVSGAAMAVEDAVVLAEMVDGTDDLAAALDAFGERRYERCRLVVEGSVELGVLHRELRFAEAHQLQGRCFGVLAQPA